MQLLATLRLAQSREIDLLHTAHHHLITVILWPQVKWFLIDCWSWTRNQAQQSFSCHLAHFASLVISVEAIAGKAFFSCGIYEITHFVQKICCCGTNLKGKRYVCRNRLCHFHSQDLNDEHLWLLNLLPFALRSILCPLCFSWRTN